MLIVLKGDAPFLRSPCNLEVRAEEGPGNEVLLGAGEDFLTVASQSLGLLILYQQVEKSQNYYLEYITKLMYRASLLSVHVVVN